MLDAIDLQILDLLQDNARIPQAEIARIVGLAPSAVLERLRKLEGRGVIRGYAAHLDPKALDQRLLAFVALRTTDRPGEARVAQALAAIPEVLEIHHVAGDDCLLLKVRARDPEHLSQILRDRLGRRRRALDAHDHRAREHQGDHEAADRRSAVERDEVPS